MVQGSPQSRLKPEAAAGVADPFTLDYGLGTLSCSDADPGDMWTRMSRAMAATR